MYNNILVAVDGSDTSDKALEESIRLAKQWGSKLRVVHVVDEVSLNRDMDVTGTGNILKEQREAARGILARAEERAKQAGTAVETRLLQLDRLVLRVADIIAEEAQSWPADLIVVGSHGRRGVRRLFLGSVAEGVSRVATTPVLLVRGE